MQNESNSTLRRARYYEYRANATRYETTGEFGFAVDEWRKVAFYAPDNDSHKYALDKLVHCAQRSREVKDVQ